MSEKIPGLTKRSWKRKDGSYGESWRLLVYDKGKPRKVRIEATTEEDAEARASEILDRLRIKEFNESVDDKPADDDDLLTVAKLCRLYEVHAESYYRDHDGKPTGEARNMAEALLPLEALFGDVHPNTIGPKALKRIQTYLIGTGIARLTINARVNRIRRMFKWAVSEELVDASVYHALQTVDGLRAGRSAAKESEPVLPVAPAHIEAVKEHIRHVVCAMIDLQLLTAARPGEIVQLTPSMIDTKGEIWTAHPKHKTQYRGHERTLYFGPRCQEILRPFLDRPLHMPLFSPKEEEAARHAAADTHRREKQKTNKRKTKRTLSDGYSVSSYRRAIHRACEKAGIKPPWNPHQLRHTRATEIRKAYGLEHAQLYLGHANADVTQVYAEADREAAERIARELG